MKKDNNIIEKITTGEEKSKTYKEMMTRHKTAMKQGFYLEALLIDYAVLEDRLEAFLWAAGVINDIGSYGFGNKYNKCQLKELYAKCFNDKKTPKLHNISGKIEVCKSLVAFSQEKYDGNDKYLKTLCEGLQKIDIIKLTDVLDAVNEWKSYRNEIIHDAMNKNIYSMYKNLVEKAEIGLKYARIIDNESRKMKRQKSIRKAVNMPPKK